MLQYRKKPVVISAIKWNGEKILHDDGKIEREVFFLYPDMPWAIENGMPEPIHTLNAVAYNGRECLEIPTLEGTMYANIGDYIIKGIKGEIYPCKPDIFEASYDIVE